MTLPSSGPLSLSDIQGEFGGSNPIGLSEYYAGGGRVPSGTSGTFGAVPSSGALAIRNFYGTSNTLETQTVTVGNFQESEFLFWNVWGYYNAVGCGSIAPGTSTIYSGASWDGIYWNNFTPGNNATAGSLFMFATGSSAPPNSGWTTVTINGTAYTRASLTYSTGSNTAEWFQSGTSACPFTQTIGASNSVVFT